MPFKNVRTAQAAKAVAPPAKTKPAPTAHDNASGPIARVGMFPISASIWQAHTGEGQPFFTVSFQRCYKDADGAWQYSDNFYASDLLVLAEAARETYHKIRVMKAGERR